LKDKLLFFLSLYCLNKWINSLTLRLWFPDTGIGYGMVVMTGIVAVYYTVIMAWTLYYLFMAFSSKLPWSSCDNPWNNALCSVRNMAVSEFANMSSISHHNVDDFANVSSVSPHIHNNGGLASNISSSDVQVARTPTEQFWEYV